MINRSTPLRYWLFKETPQISFSQKEMNLGKSKRAPAKSKQWLIEPNSGVRPLDVAYFWRDDPPSLYGWGVIESEPVPDYRSLVDVAHHLLVTILPQSKLQEDPVLKSLFELEQSQKKIIEINKEQATALNKLIRSQGTEPPPDPALEATEEQEGDAGGEQPADITLAQLLETYSKQLSPLSRTILDLAGRFSNQRERNRDLVTSSCILFAAVESGAHPKNQQVDTAAQFVFQWMFKSDSRSAKYEQARSEFLQGGDPEQRQRSATLTSNALEVIQTATTIATAVRKRGVASERRVIHARDLIGALLFGMSSNLGIGATRRFAGMEASLEDLRLDYFNEFLHHEKNKDDDIEKWRQVLINLKLPEERRIPETKPSLPNIDADTPSLKDHLNITPEVTGFANIIASRDVKTPLSIGLFGDWGSGKSTFMEQLQATVEDIARCVREKKGDEETAYLGNIVQIKFNAWHYAEANLWASLVSHVFENLSFSEAEEKEKAEKRKQLFLGKLVTSLASQKAAAVEVKVKEANYETAKTALDGVQQDQHDAQIKLSHVLAQGVWPLVRKFLQQNSAAEAQLNAARNVLGKAGLTEADLKREIDASRETAGRLQFYATSIARDPSRALKIGGIVALTVLIPLGLAFVVAQLGGSGILERVIASVAPILTLLGGLLTWLRTKRKGVNSILATLDDAGRTLDILYATARSEYDTRRDDLSKKVADSQAEIEIAKQAVQTATKEKTETLAALREMEPARVLESFVQERAASTDYRKLLGVVALIRRDFKRLSDMLREQGNGELRQAVTEILKKDQEEQKKLEAQAAAAAAGTTGVAPGIIKEQVVNEPTDTLVEETLKDYRIDRIVLYIDDLDRCPPKQVVNVLQAIHLLLAFELFVVVVGVDARWIRHALRERYPQMLSEDWNEDDGKVGEEQLAKMATPRDYVEKIFQVPFWLKPMNDTASRQLLEGLIPETQLLRSPQTNGNRDTTSQAQTVGGKERPITGGNGSGNVPGELAGKVAGSTSPEESNDKSATKTVGEAKSSAQAGGTSDAMHKKPGRVLKPENLLLDVTERDAMIALSKVIGRTPRTLKRFVNVYRIIKAGLDGEELEAFMGTGPSDAQYVAVLVLLGVAHGAPDFAPTFFRALMSAREWKFEGKPIIDFGGFLNSATLEGAFASQDPTLREGWRLLIGELSKFAKNQKQEIPMAVLRKWSPAVVRYTFQIGRLSEEVASQAARG